MKLNTIIEEAPRQQKPKGFTGNIENLTKQNTNFRKVLYTAENCQLVVMSLAPGEEIGEEVHDVDQFFRIEAGTGQAVINGVATKLDHGSGIVIPSGSRHNVINDGDEDLKIYTIYSPPHHKDGTVHKTVEDTKKDTEHFDGETTK